MSEADLGSAPAEAVPVIAPIANVDVTVAKTPNSAVDRAMARFEKGETVDDGSTPAPKKEATTDKPAADKTTKPAKEADTAPTGGDRNPDGTFKAKAADTATQPVAKTAQTPEPSKDAPKPAPVASDAPARFASDPEAKAAWAALPEPVKAATSRVIREMEQGIELYRADAKAHEPFKPFVELAKKSGMDAIPTLQNYVNIDQLLNKDFKAGIAQIFKNKGADLRTFAAEVMGQQAQPQDQTIAELREQITKLERGFGGISQTLEQQRSNGVNQSLAGFTASLAEQDQALFSELDSEIAGHLTRDPSMTLQAAFEAARKDAQDRYQRMFGASPAPVPAPAEAQTLEPDRTAQTRKAELSIHGAPGPGSDPAGRRPNTPPRKSPDDAIDRAMRNMGLA